MSTDRLVIASRESRLALWQAQHVRDRLAALYPGRRIEILGMTTTGDRLLDVTLQQAGGKGLFVKELETALAERRADLAVHSAKDVPMELPAGFRLAAILEREDPRDAFVSVRYASLESLPPRARVGTASLRREAQLRERFPHLEVSAVRGNLDTRLAKLDDGRYDALVLAAAGLKRLGLEARIRTCIDVEQHLPAPGQGALAIECLGEREDIAALVAPLEHEPTAVCVRAERALSASLAGSCRLPLAAYASMVDQRTLRLCAMVASRDGRRVVRTQASGAPGEPEALGARVAEELRRLGADAILAEVQS